MINSRGVDVLQSENTKDFFVEEFRKTLAGKMSTQEATESLAMLHGIKEELLKEISLGRRISEEIENLIKDLPEIRFTDELKVSMDRFLQLAAELYRARSPVSSTLSQAQLFYDKLITTAFYHSVNMLGNEGRKTSDQPYAVLVSGELGREESILGSRSRFFLIYREAGEGSREYFTELALRFMAVLSTCFPSISRNLNSPSAFWYGSDVEWQQGVAELLKTDESETRNKIREKSFSLRLETAADMRIICGDPDFGQSFIENGKKLLADCMQNEIFRQIAKDISTMPVAIGIFGRIKTVRSGKNRGKFDLKGMALDPLSAAVTLLSLDCGSSETSFTCRIKTILAARKTGDSLADRLLIAYHDFMRERIRLELAGTKESDGFFFNPDELDERSKERFRTGMEDITTLQRLVHRQCVEVEHR